MLLAEFAQSHAFGRCWIAQQNQTNGAVDLLGNAAVISREIVREHLTVVKHKVVVVQRQRLQR